MSPYADPSPTGDGPPPSEQRPVVDYVEELLDLDDSQPGPTEDGTPWDPSHDTSSAEQDPITGVLGGDDFSDRLEDELGRSAMRGHACTLLLASIDDFDTFDLRRDGASDEALRTVTRALRKQSRPGDTFGRTSEAELAAILPETGVAEARALAETLLSFVEWYFTVSVGLACFPVHGVTGADLMRTGRAALYEVGRRGGRAVGHLDDALPGVRGVRAVW